MVKEKNKCINNCTNDNKYKFEYNNTCYIESQKDTIYTNDININNNISSDEYEDDDLRRKEKKILNFQKDLMGGTFDDIINNVTKNKEDYVQDEGDLILQITTSENQKNNNNKNLSTIDLRDCEKKLKDVYDINETIPLLILKVDYYSKDTLNTNSYSGLWNL